MEGEKLMVACSCGEWVRARELIDESPRLMWTSENAFKYTPVYLAARHGNVEMLQYMLDTVSRQSCGDGQWKQMLRDTFERGNYNGCTPAHHAAFYGHVQCLAFLVEHAPSGASILQAKNHHGETPAHWASVNGRVDALDFIVRNAPSGLRILQMKDHFGRKPLDSSSREVIREYFTSQKIKEIGLEEELKLVEKTNFKGSFVALVLEIVKSNIVLIHRNNL